MSFFARLTERRRVVRDAQPVPAEGLGDTVAQVGGGQAAFQLLMLEHLDTLAETSAKAISNIKFDKVVVWDGGKGGGSNGSATADFIRSLATTLPPAADMLKEVAGVEMPKHWASLDGAGAAGAAADDATARDNAAAVRKALVDAAEAGGK